MPEQQKQLSTTRTIYLMGAAGLIATNWLPASITAIDVHPSNHNGYLGINAAGGWCSDILEQSRIARIEVADQAEASVGSDVSSPCNAEASSACGLTCFLESGSTVGAGQALAPNTFTLLHLAPKTSPPHSFPRVS